MAQQIRVSINDLRQSANELKSLQNSCIDLFEQMKSVSGKIDAAWDGAASNGLIDSFQDVAAQYQNLGEALEGGAQQLVGIADAFQEIEGSASSFFSFHKFSDIALVVQKVQQLMDIGTIIGAVLAGNVIRVVPEELRAAASECQQISSATKELDSRTSSVINQLRSTWEGRAADRFGESMEEVLHATRTLADTVEEYGNKIRTAAQRYEEVDSNLFA